jgi:hypothetical protein
MNWLDEFANGVETSADKPDASLALRWITAWEESTAFVKELRRQKKVSQWGTRDYIQARKRLAWFGDLRAFQRWLESRVGDPEARLVLALTAEFEHKQVQKYLTESIESYLSDPPDSDFLCGYLSALLVVAEESLGLPMEYPPFKDARDLVKSYSRDRWNPHAA